MDQLRLNLFLKYAGKAESLDLLMGRLRGMGRGEEELGRIRELFKGMGEGISGRVIGRILGEMRNSSIEVGEEYIERVIREMGEIGLEGKREERRKMEAMGSWYDMRLRELLEGKEEGEAIYNYVRGIDNGLYRLVLGILGNGEAGYGDIYKKMEEVKKLPIKYWEWLSKRYGEGGRSEVAESMEESLIILGRYHGAEAGILDKYNHSIDFQNLVKGLIGKRDLTRLADFSLGEIRELLHLYALSNLTFGAENKEVLLREPEEDKIGEVGEWRIWAPSSRERSCAAVGVDPETLDPRVQWCTARTKKSNLFYNYSLSGIIFYIIKKDPKVNEDWLSVGFRGGEPVLNGEDMISTDGANERGLTHKRLVEILGKNYDEIMRVMRAYVKSLGGISNSPTYKKVEEAVKDMESYRNFLKGNSKKEVDQFNLKILEQGIKISSQVMEEIAKSTEDDRVKKLLIERGGIEQLLKYLDNNSNFKTLHKEIIEKLTKSKDRGGIEKVLKSLILDKSEGNLEVRYNIVKHFNYFDNFVDVYVELLLDPSEYIVKTLIVEIIRGSEEKQKEIFEHLAKKERKIKPEILNYLIKYYLSNIYIAKYLIKISEDEDLLKSIYNEFYNNVAIQFLALNKIKDSEFINNILDNVPNLEGSQEFDNYNEMKKRLASESSNSQILEKLISDPSLQIRLLLASNKNAGKILEKLLEDPEEEVRIILSLNTFDNDFLEKLKEDKSLLVRNLVIARTSMDEKALRKVIEGSDKMIEEFDGADSLQNKKINLINTAKWIAMRRLKEVGDKTSKAVKLNKAMDKFGEMIKLWMKLGW